MQIIISATIDDGSKQLTGLYFNGYAIDASKLSQGQMAFVSSLVEGYLNGITASFVAACPELKLPTPAPDPAPAPSPDPTPTPSGT